MWTNYLGIAIIFRTAVLAITFFGDAKEVGDMKGYAEIKDVSGPNVFGHNKDFEGTTGTANAEDSNEQKAVGHIKDIADTKNIGETPGTGDLIEGNGQNAIGHIKDIGDTNDFEDTTGTGDSMEANGQKAVGHFKDVGDTKDFEDATGTGDSMDANDQKAVGHIKDVRETEDIGDTRVVNGSKEIGDSKIVGGVRANLVPFMVSVQRNGGHYCGASLLSLSTALSACHCIGEFVDLPGGNNSYKALRSHSPENYLLQAGDWALYIANPHSQRRNAKDFYAHPMCAKVNGILEFDFSLISVVEPFTWTPFVRPTRNVFEASVMYKERLSEIITNTKDTCWVMGWGKPESNPKYNKPITRFLKKAQMRFISDYQCQDLLGKHNPIFTYYDFDAKGQVCAIGVKFQDSDCTGDSGGPVWCRDHIMAIVSYGMPDCGRADEPAVYAKLEDFVEWYNMKRTEIYLRGASTVAMADGVTTVAPLFILCLALNGQLNFYSYVFLETFP